MKKEPITKAEAEKLGLVYTGICVAGYSPAQATKMVISSATREEYKTGITCYAVVDQGFAAVYADPIYSKRSEYYMNVNAAEAAHQDYIKANEVLEDALHRYNTFCKAAEDLKEELLKHGVRKI